jgi:hypothetical protein
MSDEKSSSTTADVIKAVAGVAAAVPIYPDMVQPAAKELGKGLYTVAKTVNLALAPLEAVVWGYEKIKEKFFPKVEERLKNVPPENIVTPRISVAGPIVEALRYAGSEEALSDLYANLLAASMDKTTATTAHPAFTEIIKQLTPDEAKLIALFPSDPYMPLIDIRRSEKSSKFESGHVIIFENYSNLGEMAGCEHMDLVPAYIDNLIRLGLAEIPSGKYYTSGGIYDSLENSKLAQAIKMEIERAPNYECEFKRKFLHITTLGKQFAKVCVIPKS